MRAERVDSARFKFMLLFWVSRPLRQIDLSARSKATVFWELQVSENRIHQLQQQSLFTTLDGNVMTSGSAYWCIHIPNVCVHSGLCQ